MEQTENYQLSLWDKDDRILMESFNADNATLDAALAAQQTALDAHAASIAKLGNCQLWVTTYTGTGGTGSVSVTFPKSPVAFLVCGGDGSLMVAQREIGQAVSMHLNACHLCSVGWNADRTTFLWNSSSGAAAQMNDKGTPYRVLALLDAEEA